MFEAVTLSTGIVVTISPLNPFFVTDASVALHKLYPPPQPPMQEVPVMASLEPGVEPKTMLEPNKSSPEYSRQLREYNNKISTKIFEWSLDEACEIDVDPSKMTALKEKYARRRMDLPEGSEKYVYLTRVAIGNQNDLELIRKTIQKLMAPTEEGIREQMDGFKSEVPGE